MRLLPWQDQIKDIFKAFDVTADRVIDVKEFQKAFEHYATFAKEMKAIVPIVIGDPAPKDLATAQKNARECFKKIKDTDADNLLDEAEFLGWCHSEPKLKHLSKEDVASIWVVLDYDGSGKIRVGEFIATCTMQYGDKNFDKTAKEHL